MQMDEKVPDDDRDAQLAAALVGAVAEKVRGPGLPVIETAVQTALSARWPDAVLQIPKDERPGKVRRGTDTVLVDMPGPGGTITTRGFVRAVLRVPLDSPQAQTYGVFVEVDRDGYAALKRAHASGQATRVQGRLATRLPLLDAAFDSVVEVLEDGSELRPRIVSAAHPLLTQGPRVGP